MTFEEWFDTLDEYGIGPYRVEGSDKHSCRDLLEIAFESGYKSGYNGCIDDCIGDSSDWVEFSAKELRECKYENNCS